MLDIYGGDKLMIRKIIIVMWMLLAFVSSNQVSAAGQLTMTDVERYLAPIYQEFEARGSKVKVDLELITPIANFNAKIDVLGVDSKSKVSKLDYQIEFLMLGKAKKEFTIQQYLEQNGTDLHVYTQLDKQWTKQIIPNLVINDKKLAEKQKVERLEFIKSVELLNYNTEQVELAVVVNTTRLYDLVEKAILADKTSFKTPEAKTEFLTAYHEIMSKAGDITYKEKIDRKNKVINSEIDFTDFTRNIVNNVIAKYDKKMKDKDKQDLAKFLAASKLTMKSEVIMLDKQEKIKIPAEVKQVAKEIPSKIQKSKAQTEKI